MTAPPEVTFVAGPRVSHPAPRRPASHSLPPELLADAARRLGWVAAIYAGGGVVAYFGRRLLLEASGSVTLAFPGSDLLGVAMLAMGTSVYLLSRRRTIPPARVLDVALVFEVLGALCIAAIPLADHQPQFPNGLLSYVPAECVWIVVFPLVVPNTPARVLIASLLAASMGPLLGVVGALAGRPIDNPMAFAANYLTTNYFCAIVAYLVARVVQGFGVQLKQLRKFGSYELLGRIGEGGMGEVWRARHRLLARPAAIKLIRADVLGSNARTRDAFIRRFEREAQETAQLGSTHTVDVFDFGVTESGDFYYVMELLEGLSLERYVELFGPMEPPRVIHVLRQVLHSLGEAHRRGLVHRDIKPANILLCRLGPDDDFVKVLDFGLVKHFDGSAGTLLTKEGSTAGTPSYMAPEIALGRPDVDGRADLYALSCVAYYLLTGQPVFTGDSEVAVGLAHVRDAPVSPSLRSEFMIPAALDALILECLAKDPGARPATAEDIDRRVASIQVRDAWTSDKAHAWWQLHQPTFCPAGNGDADLVTASGDSSDPSTRCWPRLERRYWTNATTVGL
jgi:eukaryotic-like serine/threonine-protein kinase